MNIELGTWTLRGCLGVSGLWGLRRTGLRGLGFAGPSLPCICTTADAKDPSSSCTKNVAAFQKPPEIPASNAILRPFHP